MEISHAIIYAVVPIIVVMFAGFLAGKRGTFTDADAKQFNKVVLTYALPAALFVSIVQADRAELLKDLKLSVVAVIGIMTCFMLVYFIFRCFKGNTGADAAISALISGSPTIGFLGFAVLEPIFGTTPAVALVVAIVGIVVNAIGIPVGLTLLDASLEQQAASSAATAVSAGSGSSGSSARASRRRSPWQPVVDALSQPVAWAPILAVVLVACGLHWPAWASPSFKLIAGANASLAVFSAGITLSAIKFTLNTQALLGSFFKMIVMPAMLLGLGILVGMEPQNIKMLVVAGSLPPAFSGIIIADEYDTYTATGTSSLALSVLLFIGFCPLWIYLCNLLLPA